MAEDEEQDGRQRRSKRKRATTSFQQFYISDEEDEVDPPSATNFDIIGIVQGGAFPERHVRRMHGADFSYEYVQRHGFREPVLFDTTEGLGITVPPPSFTVSDVMERVGTDRVLDVVDVRTQDGLQMTMAEWTDYYTDLEKEDLLNVISLEFSHSPLDAFVQSPAIVRQIDWVDLVWPRRLKQLQTSDTNSMKDMKYPKVQKYCLMSVGGCYTDWHIDFGGTSVWYHVLRGEKVFFLIPPTSDTLRKFEKWSKCAQNKFFGDYCKAECGMVTLKAGNTFMIPTGWIHAVYTPVDSLVFGGNFLHGFNVPGQLQIADLERRLKVPAQYQFPFFERMMWYAANQFQHRLETLEQSRQGVSWFEAEGMRALSKELANWCRSAKHKKQIPRTVLDPTFLVTTLQDMLSCLKPAREDCRARFQPPAALPQPPGAIGCSVAAARATQTLTDAEEAVLYARIAAVRQLLRDEQPTMTEAEITSFAQRRWAIVTPHAKSLFRSLFQNPQRYELLTRSVAIKAEAPGQMDADSAANERKTKYERKSWRAPKEAVQRARALQALRHSRDSRPRAAQQPIRLHAAPSQQPMVRHLTAQRSAMQPQRVQTYGVFTPAPVPQYVPPPQMAAVVARPVPVIRDPNLDALYSLPGLNAPAPRVAQTPAVSASINVTFAPQQASGLWPPHIVIPAPLPSALLAQQAVGSHAQPHAPQQRQPLLVAHVSGGLPPSRQAAPVPRALPAAPVHRLAPSGILSLPDSVLLLVFALLDQHELVRTLAVSRRFKAVGESPRLWQRVDCSASTLSIPAFERLVQFRPVHVNLSWSTVTDSQVRRLLCCSPALESLHLDGCAGLSNLTIALQRQSAERCRLKHVSLAFLRSLTDSCAASVCLIAGQLRSLNVSGTALSDRGLQQILSSARELRELALYQCWQLTNAALLHIAAKCPFFETIDLRFTSVTPVCLQAFMNCRHLKEVDLRDCRAVLAHHCDGYPKHSCLRLD